MSGLLSLYRKLSSAHPSALSSPAGGSRAHFVSHLSLFPAPVSLSSNAWHPLQLAFSHTFHTGWRLGGEVKREQRWSVKCAGVMGRRQDISELFFCLSCSSRDKCNADFWSHTKESRILHNWNKELWETTQTRREQKTHTAELQVRRQDSKSNVYVQ